MTTTDFRDTTDAGTRRPIVRRGVRAATASLIAAAGLALAAPGAMAADGAGEGAPGPRGPAAPG
ncbi:hypothetical protein [Corynebacterium sp. 335C]